MENSKSYNIELQLVCNDISKHSEIIEKLSLNGYVFLDTKTEVQPSQEKQFILVFSKTNIKSNELTSFRYSIVNELSETKGIYSDVEISVVI